MKYYCSVSTWLFSGVCHTFFPVFSRAENVHKYADGLHMSNEAFHYHRQCRLDVKTGDHIGMNDPTIYPDQKFQGY